MRILFMMIYMFSNFMPIELNWAYACPVFIFMSRILFNSSPRVISFIFLFVAFSNTSNLLTFPFISYSKFWFYPNFYITGSLNLAIDSYISSRETKLSWVLSIPKVVIILSSNVSNLTFRSSSKVWILTSLVLLLSLSLLTSPSIWHNLWGSRPLP